jgi:hypothetical protein
VQPSSFRDLGNRAAKKRLLRAKYRPLETNAYCLAQACHDPLCLTFTSSSPSLQRFRCHSLDRQITWVQRVGTDFRKSGPEHDGARI